MKIKSLKEENCNFDAYQSWLNGPRSRFLGKRGGRWSYADLRNYISTCESSPDVFLYGVFHSTEGHVGNVKVSIHNKELGRAELSILMAPYSAREGVFASNVIRRVSEIAFNDLDVERIEAGCIVDNHRAINAFINSGYGIEGRMRRYALLDEQWVDVYLFSKINDDKRGMK